MGRLAKVLNDTGSFSSTQQSLELVQVVALKGIETIIQLAQSLESAFMVDVTSSDVFLLLEAPDAEFDNARMTSEFGSGSPFVPGRQDRIVGTTEVGVGKSTSSGAGESRRTQILLKPKVVLKKDVVGDDRPTDEA